MTKSERIELGEFMVGQWMSFVNGQKNLPDTKEMDNE